MEAGRRNYTTGEEFDEVYLLLESTMDIDGVIKNAAIVGFIGVVVSATISGLVAWIVAKRTSANTMFTVRATVRTGYRTRWLEEFRECATEFIYLGQQVHSPLPDASAASLDERRALRKRGAQLRVLLGRGSQRDPEDARPKLAKLVGAYANSPSAELEAEIEDLIRAVFRERWNQITHETGAI